MPDDDLAVLAGRLGAVRVRGRDVEIREPTLRRWARANADLATVIVSLLASATSAADSPAVALAFLSLPPPFWDALRGVVAVATGRPDDPGWVGQNVRVADAFRVVDAVTDGTATGDALAGVADRFFGVREPPPDPAGKAWGWAGTFDLLASEYGWTLPDVLDMTPTQVGRYADAMRARHERAGGTETGVDAPPSGEIDMRDPTWQIAPRASAADCADLPSTVTAKFVAAGYSGVWDYHVRGAEKVRALEAAEAARTAVRAGGNRRRRPVRRR